MFNQLNFSLITQTPCSQKMRGIKCFPMPQVLAQNHNHVLPAVQGPQVCVTNSCSFPAQTFPALFLLFSCPDFSSWAHSLEAKAVWGSHISQTNLHPSSFPSSFPNYPILITALLNSIAHSYSNIIYMNNFPSISIANAAGCAVHALEQAVNSNLATTNFKGICYCWKVEYLNWESEIETSHPDLTLPVQSWLHTLQSQSLKIWEFTLKMSFPSCKLSDFWRDYSEYSPLSLGRAKTVKLW